MKRKTKPQIQTPPEPVIETASEPPLDSASAVESPERTMVEKEDMAGYLKAIAELEAFENYLAFKKGRK